MRLFRSRRNKAKDFFDQGIKYAKNDQWALSLTYLSKAIKFNPKLTDAYVNRGLVYIAQEQYALAEQDLTHALSMDKSDPAWLAYICQMRAFALLNMHQYAQAIEDLNASIRFGENTAGIQSLLGQCFMYLEQWDIAIAHYLEATRLDPSLTNSFHGLGMCYFSKGKWSESKLALDAAIRLDRRNADTYTLRARCLLELAHQELSFWRHKSLLQACLKDANKAIRLDQQSAYRYAIRAHCLLLLDRTVEAFENLDKALRLDNQLGLAYKVRGLCHKHQSNYARAMEEFIMEQSLTAGSLKG